MGLSPLTYPVKIKGNYLEVLDETALPFEEKYLKVRNLKEAMEVLGSMKTRAFGQVLLFFYSCVLFDDFAIDEIVEKFKKTRPTFDFSLLGRILKEETKSRVSLKEAVAEFVTAFDNSRRDRAKRLADILPCPAKILTICNVNAELIYLYEELKKLGKEAIFYVSETRPYLQGTRLTFWELRRSEVPAYLICDNQAASLMKDKKVNCVVSGADRATRKGDIVNKIGTYSLARLAKYFNIPFYPLTQYPQDIDVETIEIEERPKEELLMFVEGDFDNLKTVYPSFDLVKREFITDSILLVGSNLDI